MAWNSKAINSSIEYTERSNVSTRQGKESKEEKNEEKRPEKNFTNIVTLCFSHRIHYRFWCDRVMHFQSIGFTIEKNGVLFHSPVCIQHFYSENLIHSPKYSWMSVHIQIAFLFWLWLWKKFSCFYIFGPSSWILPNSRVKLPR